MGCIEYEKAILMYEGDPYMKRVLNGMMQLDEYHLLRNSDISSEELSWMPSTMESYKKWLHISDGGYLFATTMLCIHGYDEMFDIHFKTLDEVNKQRGDYSLSDEYVIIALRNYGAPICMTDTDEKVRLWDIENKRVSTVWNSFADFLGDELNTAIDLIEEDALDIIPLKAEKV